MAMGKTQRILTTTLIFLWTLWFVYSYKYIGVEYKQLIEFINIFLFGFVWFLYNKNTFTLILICILAWNVAEESGVLLGNDFIKYTAFLVPVIYVFRIKSLFRISLNKLFTIFAEH